MKKLSKAFLSFAFTLVMIVPVLFMSGCGELSNEKTLQLAKEGKYAGVITDINQTLEVDVTNDTEVVFIVASSTLSGEVSVECATTLSLVIQHLLDDSEPYEFSTDEAEVSTTYSATLGSGIYKIKVISGLQNKSDVLKIVSKQA